MASRAHEQITFNAFARPVDGNNNPIFSSNTMEWDVLVPFLIRTRTLPSSVFSSPSLLGRESLDASAAAQAAKKQAIIAASASAAIKTMVRFRSRFCFLVSSIVVLFMQEPVFEEVCAQVEQLCKMHARECMASPGMQLCAAK